MALNIATFRKRLLTAVVFVAIMLLGLIGNQWTFFILFTIIHFGCWIEYQRILDLVKPEYREITAFHRYGVMIAGWCVLLYFTNDVFNIRDLSLHSVGFWLGLMFVFVLPLVELLLAKQVSGNSIGLSLGGLVYISLSLALMIGLYEYHAPAKGIATGPNIPLALTLAIWINDTMAYLVGSFIGKTPFSKISPKKTWEGTLGGIILTILIIGFAGSSQYSMILGIPQDAAINGNPIEHYHWFIIAALAGVAGTIGDLFESKLKRTANIKDSGHIMPGHGGFLDRFDSVLFAVPVVYVYVWLFM